MDNINTGSRNYRNNRGLLIEASLRQELVLLVTITKLENSIYHPIQYLLSIANSFLMFSSLNSYRTIIMFRNWINFANHVLLIDFCSGDYISIQNSVSSSTLLNWYRLIPSVDRANKTPGNFLCNQFYWMIMPRQICLEIYLKLGAKHIISVTFISKGMEILDLDILFCGQVFFLWTLYNYILKQLKRVLNRLCSKLFSVLHKTFNYIRHLHIYCFSDHAQYSTFTAELVSALRLILLISHMAN